MTQEGFGQGFFFVGGSQSSPQPQPQQQRVIIEGAIKELKDDPSIPMVKLDKATPVGWVPYNYDPKTGEIKEI